MYLKVPGSEISRVVRPNTTNEVVDEATDSTQKSRPVLRKGIIMLAYGYAWIDWWRFALVSLVVIVAAWDRVATGGYRIDLRAFCSAPPG